MHPADVDPDLERLVHDELRGLPVPSAPSTLLPRVMAAVARAEQPWYSRAWPTWPRAWQAASVAVLVAIVAGGWIAVPLIAASMPAGISSAARALDDAATVTRVFRRALLQPAAACVFLLVMLSTSVAAAGWGLWKLEVGIQKYEV